MNQEQIKTAARILGWSTVLGFGIVTIWFAAFLTGFVCNIHGPMFNLSLHECEVFSYGGLALTKILIIVFLFLPWLAIKIVLKKKSSRSQKFSE